MLLSSLGTSIANVALPTLAQAFHASFQQVQWIVLAYLLAVTAFLVGAGRLGDRLGRRRLLVAGIFLFTSASVGCGIAPTLPLLIAARAAQGLGAAAMMALAMAFVGETVPKEKSGAAMGLLGTMSAAGTALGPSLGGFLIAGFGWPAVFFVSVPFGIVTLLLAHRFLPANALRPAPIRLAMFGDPVLSAGFAMSTLVTTVVMATLVVGPFYLSGTLGLDAARVGLVMSCGPLVAALAGVPAGRAVDRFGARRITIAGLVAMAAGSALLPMLPVSFGVIGYIAPLAAITAGYALFQAANNTAVMADIRPDQRGVVSGMLNLSRNLGLIAGASVMGSIFAAGGMRLTFAVAAALVVLALGIVPDQRVRRTVRDRTPAQYTR
ncbi:MAG TPA: MFS transporter [Thermoanaerobaculia bacterium]|nr:MFS transporter [Thermoanaerobaculia bacterium]